MPVGNQADFVNVQPGSERHALATDVAADRQQCGQSIPPTHDCIGAGRKKMAENIDPVIDVNENIGYVASGKSRLDQFFESLDCIRLVGRFQCREVKLALLAIDGQRLVVYRALWPVLDCRVPP